MKNKRVKAFFAGCVFVLISFQIISCGGGNNDAAIQTKITSITQSKSELQNVSASVSEGVVTLIGQAQSENDREKAEKTIKNIDDVKDVINNITVTENVEFASDDQLRDQTKQAVKKYKHLQAEVNKGIITLRGSVDKDDLSQLMMELNALKPKRIDNQLVVE